MPPRFGVYGLILPTVNKPDRASTTRRAYPISYLHEQHAEHVITLAVARPRTVSPQVLPSISLREPVDSGILQARGCRRG